LLNVTLRLALKNYAVIRQRIFTCFIIIS